ncbi:AraC family transcriptional regulator [Fictibacillus nanhaiensis]|uniref:AraC family transcriptional regulator n=1 Tax=Fictibacillus nanhaiensis TaxID=742169 RepID=UPI001C983FD0|nr:AraC family transcriptional regulator [Fictibacillus nanhaiensis]MBY6037002.1 AraC family transcriptional regulator [Fictibacillus nanhaiensis]
MGFNLKLEHIKFLMIEGANWSDEQHSHEDVYQISVPLTGRLIADLNQKTYSMSEGEALITNPLSSHSHLFEDVPSSMFLIGLDREALNTWMKERNGHHEIEFREHQVISSFHIKKQVKYWFNHYLFDNHQDSYVIEDEVFKFFTTLFDGSYSKQHFHDSVHRHPDFLVKKVLDFIHSNYDKEINVETLARIAQQSKYHFIRNFKKFTNQTPYQYLLQIRIEKGKELLLNTDKSVLEISYELGFSNPSQFYRNFIKVTGCTPIEFKGS